MENSVHPPRPILIAFAEGNLPGEQADSVEKHLEDCEFCREFCEDWRAFTEAESEVGSDAPVDTLARRLHRGALSGSVIELSLMPDISEPTAMPLAADGVANEKPRTGKTLTLFSEEPEIVLRVIRGARPSDNYLQLIADDSSLVSKVLIQVPELDREYLTDDNGRADLGATPPEFTEDLKWQIKMPDAVFDLEPLTYDPEKTEYSRQIILETERQDRIEITFEGKTEGKKLSLRILALEGNTDVGEVTVVVEAHQSLASSDTPAVFELAAEDKTINIRLFAR